MPDTAIEAPTRAQVLTSTKHEVRQSTIDAAVGPSPSILELQNIQDGARLAETARNAGKEHPSDLKKELAEVGRVARFSETDLGTLSRTLDATDPRVKNAVDRLTNIVKYTEGARKAESSGTSIEATLGTEWSAIRDSVVDTIVNDGNLLSKFPEINDISNPDARIAFLEEVVARDKRFHNAISSELQRILGEAKEKLKPDPQAEELQKAKQAKEDHEELQKDRVERIRASLKSQGVDDDRTELILKSLNTGNAELVISGALDDIIAAKGIKNPAYIQSYLRDTSDISAAETDLKVLQRQLNNERGKTGKQNNPDQIANFETQAEAAQKRINDAKAAQERRKNFYQSEFHVDEAGFETDVQNLLGAKDFVGPESAFSREIHFAVENGKLLREAERTYSTLASNTEIQERTTQREKAKETAITDLENAIANSMGIFLEKKYEDALADQNVRLSAEAKKAEKEGKKYLASSTKKVKDALTALSRYDTTKRKWVRSRTNIGSALHEYAAAVADGKDGSHAFIAKAIGYNMDETTQRNNLAAELFPQPTPTTYENLTPEQKVQVDAMFKETTDAFNSLVASQSETIKTRLMGDYMAEKGIIDKLSSGKLSLTSDELKLIESQLGSTIDSTLESTEKGRQALQKLKAQGITPSFKTKWLLYILLGLGLAIPTGLAIGGVGLAGGALGTTAGLVGGGAGIAKDYYSDN